MGKKAQLSADFAVIAAVVLIIALFLVELYSQRMESARIMTVHLSAQRTAEDVARSINHAWLAGNGSVAHSQLPDSLPNGAGYNLTIRGRQVLVYYPAGDGIRIASAGTITSNISSANITIIPGSGGVQLNITNANNTIRVTW